MVFPEKCFLESIESEEQAAAPPVGSLARRSRFPRVKPNIPDSALKSSSNQQPRNVSEVIQAQSEEEPPEFPSSSAEQPQAIEEQLAQQEGETAMESDREAMPPPAIPPPSILSPSILPPAISPRASPAPKVIRSRKQMFKPNVKRGGVLYPFSPLAFSAPSTPAPDISSLGDPFSPSFGEILAPDSPKKQSSGGRPPKKFTGEEVLDRSIFTMADLIYWNPKNDTALKKYKKISKNFYLENEKMILGSIRHLEEKKSLKIVKIGKTWKKKCAKTLKKSNGSFQFSQSDQ
jgi:hypothetical protein